MVKGHWNSITGTKKLSPLLAKLPNKNDQVKLDELIEVGKIQSVIDRSYLLDEFPEALRYLSQGYTREKIEITV